MIVPYTQIVTTLYIQTLIDMELIPLTYILCVTIIGLFMHCPHGSHDAYKKENTQSRYCQNSQLLKDMEAALNLRIHTSNLALQVNGRTLKQGPNAIAGCRIG